MRNRILKIYFFAFIIFLYLPILILILFSFNENKGRTFTGFSLKWYMNLFGNQTILDGIITSMAVAFTSAIIATVLGTVSALGISRMKGRKKSIYLNFTYLPILNPEIITGVSFMLLFVTSKKLLSLLHINFEFGLTTLILAHITFNMPYVILNVLPKLYQLDSSLVDSAMDLGCNRIQTLVKVVLPEIRPGIFAGFLMAITFSMDDFVVSYFTTGIFHQPLSVLIFSMTKKRISPEINALSTIIFFVILVSLLLVNSSNKKEIEPVSKGKRLCLFAFLPLILTGTLLINGISGVGLAKTSENYYNRYKNKGIKLHVYNWGEYMALGSEGHINIIKEFEKKTGIKVIYSNFDNNESMYSKVKSNANSYDLIIPSDYMVSRMINEGLLKPINFKNIPNYKYIDKNLKNPSYDRKGLYSVPYAFGITALVYNKKFIKKKPDSWKILWDKKYKNKILMFKNSRDAFAISESILGIDLNSSREKDLKRAEKFLMKQKPVVQSYVQDQIFDKMEGNEAAVAPCYVGDGFVMMQTNKNLDIALPKETKNLFVDAMVIPKNAKQKIAAEMFINFLNEPHIAAENISYIMYSTPNTAAKKLLPENQKLNPMLYPDEKILKSCTAFTALSKKGNLTMDRLWAQLMLPGNNRSSKIILFFVIVILFLFYLRAKIKRKKILKKLRT